jgi:hypothetical protein
MYSLEKEGLEVQLGKSGTLFILQKFFFIKYPVIKIGLNFKMKFEIDSIILVLSLYIKRKLLSSNSRYLDGVKYN